MKQNRTTLRGHSIVALVLIMTVFLTACNAKAVVPPPQVIQACSIGDPQSVTDKDGQPWDCSSVRGAFPTATSTSAPAAPAATSAPATTAPAAVPTGSLKFDETGGMVLAPGQTKLIALYYRLPAPITQAALENAVKQTQLEAKNAKAEVHQGKTLKLDQRKAWGVWCSNATKVDPPSDVSLVHELSLLAATTVGRFWVQVPFAEGVPLRNDDTWTDCQGEFWATRLD